jgi:hypothetical protein
MKNRIRLYALVGSAALAGVLLAIVPALGQVNDAEAVYFQLNESGAPVFEYDGAEQPLTTPRNGCQITSAEPLINLEADGNKVPGLNGLAIGVKSSGSNANGTPCSQIDSTETLSVTPGSELSDRAFSGVKLDLEMTGNAIVKISFLPADDVLPDSVYRLHTGTNFQVLCGTTPDANGCPTNTDDDTATPPYEIESEAGVTENACAAPNSSGPNNGGNDNCIWTIDPGYDFTKIELTVDGVGTVSLEAGVDTGMPSRFYLAVPPDAVDDQVFIDGRDYDGTNALEIDVLANDTGSSLTITDVQLPGVISTDGTKVLYTPPADFTGSVLFTYTVTDANGRTDTAIVTVTETLECGETLSVPENDLGVSGEYERLTSPGGCVEGKPYTVDVVETDDGETTDIPTVLFQPRPQEGDPVSNCSLTPDDCDDEFRAELTFQPRAKDNAPDTGTLRYDPVAQDDPALVVYRDMQWCVFDPFDAPIGSSRRDALPDGESWCIVSATVTIADGEQTSTTWITYGIGDPWKIAT